MLAGGGGVSPASSTVSSLIGDLEHSARCNAYGETPVHGTSGSGTHDSRREYEHQYEPGHDNFSDSSKRRRIHARSPENGRRNGLVVGGLYDPIGTAVAAAACGDVFGGAGFPQATTGAAGMFSGGAGALIGGVLTGGLPAGGDPLAARSGPAGGDGGFAGASTMNLERKKAADGGSRRRTGGGSGNTDGTGTNLTDDHLRFPGSASTSATAAIGADPGNDLQNGTVYGEQPSTNEPVGFANRSGSDITGVFCSSGISLYSSHAPVRSTSSTGSLAHELDLGQRPHLMLSSQIVFAGLPVSSEAERAQLPTQQAAAAEGGTYGGVGSIGPGSDPASHGWPKWA